MENWSDGVVGPSSISPPLDRSVSGMLMLKILSLAGYLGMMAGLEGYAK